MADEKGTKPDRDALLKSIRERRENVIELVATVCPAIRGEAFLEKQLAVSQQNVLATLFHSKGFTNPKVVISHDFIEFMIDKDLWWRWRGKEPATFHHLKPSEGSRIGSFMLGSLKMRQYQLEQLAKTNAAAEATEAIEKAKKGEKAVTAAPAPDTTGICQLPYSTHIPARLTGPAAPPTTAAPPKSQPEPPRASLLLAQASSRVPAPVGGNSQAQQRAFPRAFPAPSQTPPKRPKTTGPASI